MTGNFLANRVRAVALRKQVFTGSALRTQQLAEAVLAESVVACPAEAVWGLSCHPFSWLAVESLLQMKQRDVAKGLIVVVAEAWMLAPVLEPIEKSQRQELSMSWPGPNTWLVPNRGVFPPWVTGDSDEVAVRVTSAPALRALSLAVGGPLISTSANPAGAQPARHSFQVARYFGPDLLRAAGQVDLAGKPSTIRRIGTGDVIRA